MAAAVAVENLLSRQADLDRTPGHTREVRHDDLVVEGVGLPTESAAVGSRDDSYPRGRQFENLRKGPMDVMRRLCRRPERQLVVRSEVRHGRVLLEREVGAAVVKEEIFVNAI